MNDPFDRRIGFIGVALVRGKVKHDFSIWKAIKQCLDYIIRNINFTNNAPFLWISLAYRYGIKNDLTVEFQRIDKKYGDLPIAIELDMEILQWADSHNLGLMYDIFMIAALEALIQVGEKYKLPTEVFREERNKYGNIPSTIEECTKYPQIPMAELSKKLDASYRDRLIINRCSSCGTIKKTTKARQCLECGTFADPILE